MIVFGNAEELRRDIETLGKQIALLAEREKNDMLQLTQSIITLRGSIPEVKPQKDFTEEIVNLAFSVQEIKKKEEVLMEVTIKLTDLISKMLAPKQEPPKPKTPEEVVKEQVEEVKETIEKMKEKPVEPAKSSDGKAYCFFCKKQTEMKDTEKIGTRIRGKCAECGQLVVKALA